MDKVFDAGELARGDAKEGRPCYVAYQGLVYDLTGSVASWTDGEHYLEHEAGMDLTESMANAPHGPEVLEAFPVVGRYQA